VLWESESETARPELPPTVLEMKTPTLMIPSTFFSTSLGHGYDIPSRQVCQSRWVDRLDACRYFVSPPGPLAESRFSQERKIYIYLLYMVAEGEEQTEFRENLEG
jgi:hypothetical protein